MKSAATGNILQSTMIIPIMTPANPKAVFLDWLERNLLDGLGVEFINSNTALGKFATISKRLPYKWRLLAIG